MKLTLILVLFSFATFGADVIVGKGCTTATLIDHDCDGYGVGATAVGPFTDLVVTDKRISALLYSRIQFVSGGTGGTIFTTQNVTFTNGCTGAAGTISIGGTGIPNGVVAITNQGTNCTAVPTQGTVTTVTGTVTFTGGSLASVVTSASHTFDSDDIQRTMPITGGTGFSVGTVSVVNTLSGAAEVNTVIGAIGITGGHYNIIGTLGPDADDEDATVNTVASWRTKYGSGPGDDSNATLSAFLLASRGYAPTNYWFMSTTGNDGTCAANNINLPCASFNKTYTSHTAGGMVVIRGGLYLENNNYSVGGKTATALAPDYIMGYPGEQAVLDHGSLFGGTSGWLGIAGQLGTSPYLTVDNLKLNNTPCVNTQFACGFGINVPQDGITIRNVEVANYFDGIWNLGGYVDAIYENNFIHDNTGSGQNEHNIYIGDPSATPTAANIIIRGNILGRANRDNFHNNGACSGCTVTGNILYSSNMVGGGAGSIALQNGFHDGFVTNNVVLFNSAYGYISNDYFDATPINNGAQNNNLIANNTFIYTGISEGGVDLSLNSFTVLGVFDICGQSSPCTPSTTPDLGHNTYINNVIINAAAGTWDGAQALGSVVQYLPWNSGDLDALSTDTWKNNIVYATPSTGGAVPLFQGFYSTLPCSSSCGKTFMQFGAAAGVFTNNSQSDPMLTAYDPLSFNLPGAYNPIPLAGSPTISAGLHAGAPTTDIRGLPRGNPPTIGAYEFQSNSTSGSQIRGKVHLGGKVVVH